MSMKRRRGRDELLYYSPRLVDIRLLSKPWWIKGLTLKTRTTTVGLR